MISKITCKDADIPSCLVGWMDILHWLSHASSCLSSGRVTLVYSLAHANTHQVYTFDSIGPCHIHDKMRSRKPDLKDKLPNQLCLLYDRPFCIDHKGIENGICEINHETYYRRHPALQENIYRTYEDWKKDHEQMVIDEASGIERQARVGSTKGEDGKSKQKD